MRKKTLSIVAALFMCACGAWGQTWDAAGLKTSSPMANGDFVKGTVFYTIQGKAGSGYLRSDVLNNNSLNSRAEATDGDAGRWAVIGNTTDGFQIVNKATKTAISMSKDFTITNENNTTYPTASSLTADFTSANTRFDITTHVKEDGYWVITAHGDNSYFWNDLTSNNQPSLGYWYTADNRGYKGWYLNDQGDDGASFKFTEVEEYNPDTTTPTTDLDEAKAAFEAYLEETFYPLMEELEELDTESEEYKALKPQILAIYTLFGTYNDEEDPTDVAGYTDLLNSFKAVVKDYNDAKSGQQPEMSDAEKAFETAYAQLKAFFDKYVVSVDEETGEFTYTIDNPSEELIDLLYVANYDLYMYGVDGPEHPTTNEDFEKFAQNLIEVVDDIEEAVQDMGGAAETDLDKAKAAYDAAVAEYMALIEQYGSLANTSAEAHEIIETLSTSIKWVVDKDATAEEYNTVANSIKTGVEAAAEALEEIAGSTPTVAHFPEAGTYYVTFTGQATDGRKNSLYNDLTQADGFTLQSDAPTTVTNNYVWRVVADGSKMTLVNGQGSTMKLCSGQNPVITELGYEAHNNAYYLLTSAQGITNNHNCLNVSDGGYKNAAGTPAVTTWSTNAGPDAGDNHWAVTEVAASSVYNVVVEGNEEGYAILGSEYAGNNGFFLSSDVANNVSAKDVDHFSYTVNIEEETKTIKVTYTATEDPIKVTYKVYVDNDIVSGFEKMEYVGDAISFNTVIPEYVEVTADIPETVPTEGIVEIHTSYKEGALPFDVNGNYNLALNRTPNLNIYVDAEGGIHTQNVASTEETEDNYVWTIGGDWYNGFTLKSKAAEKYVSFGSANPTNKYQATLVEGTGEGATFDLVQAGGNNYFKIHGTTTDAYISNNGGVGTTFLTNWNSAGNIGDAGAQFIFTKVEDAPEVDPELAAALAEFYTVTGEWIESLTTKYGHVSPTESAANYALINLTGIQYGYAYINVPKNQEEIDAAYAAIKAAIKEFYESCTIEQLSKVIGQENTTLEDIENIKKGILRTIDVDELYKTGVTE